MNLHWGSIYKVALPNGSASQNTGHMTSEESAVVPYGAIMALNLCRKVNIQPGQKFWSMEPVGG